ncbi:MAG TPA: response regulator [Chryseosolibacter sp.]
MKMKDGVEILLVEDNMSDAELTIRALRRNNLANNLLHVKNGAEALNFIFAEGMYSGRNPIWAPKIILLDLKMPKMDGLQVLAAIRGAESTNKIPVVMLTSSREDPDIDACYRLGANSYIVKPVEFENFTKIVTDLAFYWLLHNQAPGHMRLHP